uniref:Transmembrane protein 255B n=1 Tax=Astyanax mexicanus TaxID=7994 RepID=A0A3B1K0M4_ASTMX
SISKRSFSARGENSPAGKQYTKRRRTALWCTVALLVLSIIVLVIGLLSATRTGNVTVAGYYPGIILVASIIFVSLGVISCFFCAIIDGIIAAEFIDRRPLMEGRCQFYASGTGYAYDNYYTEVTCQSFNEQCNLKVKSNTCYCCDLYSCGSPEYHAHYFEFTGVSSCFDVVHLHRLLWSSVVLNVLGVFLGIVTAAILGAYKDMSCLLCPCPPVLQAPAVQTQMSPSPAPPPHILYNPTQHMVTYAGFCPSGQALPAYPNYPMPMQVTTATVSCISPFCSRPTVNVFYFLCFQHLNSYPAAGPSQPSPEVA